MTSSSVADPPVRHFVQLVGVVRRARPRTRPVLVGATVAVGVLGLAGCTFDVAVGESVEAGVAEGLPDGADSVDSCTVRTNMGESDQHEVCYVGDLTSRRVQATGLQPGSELEIVDSNGETMVVPVPVDADYASAGAGLDVELAVPPGPSEIVVRGVWSDGVELEFVVEP